MAEAFLVVGERDTLCVLVLFAPASPGGGGGPGQPRSPFPHRAHRLCSGALRSPWVGACSHRLRSLGWAGLTWRACTLSQWSCCGARGPNDWNLNIYFNCTDLNPSRERCGVPFSCCVRDPAVRRGWGRGQAGGQGGRGRDGSQSTPHLCPTLSLAPSSMNLWSAGMGRGLPHRDTPPSSHSSPWDTKAPHSQSLLNVSRQGLLLWGSGDWL